MEELAEEDDMKSKGIHAYRNGRGRSRRDMKSKGIHAYRNGTKKEILVVIIS